jgi:hypothetical protein
MALRSRASKTEELPTATFKMPSAPDAEVLEDDPYRPQELEHIKTIREKRG